MLVNHIFQSISGEVGIIPQGAITWFIRFQSCNLRCKWCDTQDALGLSSDCSVHMTSAKIAAQIPKGSNIVITGGEPLFQNMTEMLALVELLHTRNCLVQIETNGSFRASLPCPHIFDYKTPSSGMDKKMMDDFYFLEGKHPGTWIKFVVKDMVDLQFTIDRILKFNQILPGLPGIKIAISVESGDWVTYAIRLLYENIPGSVNTQSALMARIVFNFQLHKYFNLK